MDKKYSVIEKITSKSLMMDSLEGKEELEELFDGLEVGKSEFLIKQIGIHLNPATALKTLGKKILRKDEKNSILGLDEEDEK